MRISPPSVFLTFGDGDFRYKRASKRLLNEALSTGLYEKGFALNLEWLRAEDQEIFALADRWMKRGDFRGIGYWAWKASALMWASQSFPKHLIHYMDAGHVILPGARTNSILASWLSEAHENKGLAWSLINHREVQWTKKEVLDHLDPQKEWLFSDQIEAAFIAVRSNVALELSSELRSLFLQNDGFLLSDEVKVKQYAEFRSHRHDQSIFSLLWKSLQLGHRPSATWPPTVESVVLAARHASGFAWTPNKRDLLQGCEFHLGKIQKGSMITRRKVSNWLNLTKD